MGKISDEIRKWCEDDGEGAMRTIKQLYTLADRIDAELVELPKDADGVPIHVGDVVYLDDGRKAVVTHIDLMWGTSCIACFASGKDHDCFPSGISHTRPDSWERIANELDEQAGSLTADGYTWQEDAIHDFADRIRKLAEREGEQ